MSEVRGRGRKQLYICIICQAFESIWASLVAQTVKNLPVMQESSVQFLSQEDPLEKEIATQSGILAWTEEPGWLQSMGSQRHN